MEKINNYEEFQKLIKQDLMILIAKTKNCVVCKPLTFKLAKFMEDYKTIPTYELYLEDTPIFSGQHLVFTVPTILVFSDGHEILRESRFIDFSKIEKLFNIFLS